MQYTHKERIVCFHPKDDEAFSEALRARWPNLTIWPARYEWLQKKGPHAKENWKDVPELTSMSDKEWGYFRVFLKPKGWRPRWRRKPDRFGQFHVDNLPPAHFTYSRCPASNSNSRTGKKARFPIDIGETRISASYPTDDADGRRFVAAVWKIIEEITTREMDAFSDTSGMLVFSGTVETWCGHHAVEWCGQRQHRTLDGQLRPRGTTTVPIKYLIGPPRSLKLDDGTPIAIEDLQRGAEQGWLTHPRKGWYRRATKEEWAAKLKALRAKGDK